jgi:hypothetical protein
MFTSANYFSKYTKFHDLAWILVILPERNRVELD